MEVVMPEIRPGVCIAVGNQKGGVGKSTNTVHLAAALGEKGYLSLIIDLDPSAGATKHLGIPPHSFAGTLELVTTEETPETLAITDELPTGVHLIPARPELSELDHLLSKFADRTRILERSLTQARPIYDFIFLDTPPNPGATTTVAAYSAAEWFLLSAFPHPLSVGGLNEALKDIADVRARRNPGLEVLGVIITAVDARSNLWREVDELVNRELPGRGFKTIISASMDVARCPGKGRTLLQIKGSDKHPVANQYRSLAEEIEERVLNRESFIAGTLNSTFTRPTVESVETVEIEEPTESEQDEEVTASQVAANE
jgi:chromosome partitioning protein